MTDLTRERLIEAMAIGACRARGCNVPQEGCRLSRACVIGNNAIVGALDAILAIARIVGPITTDDVVLAAVREFAKHAPIAGSFPMYKAIDAAINAGKLK